MVFECKIIGAIFLVLKDLYRDKNAKVKNFTYLQAFCHPGWICPHTPTPKRFCTLAALNINLLAEQKLKVSKHIRQEIFGRVSGSSIRSVRPLSFPAPPLLTSAWKWVTLGDLSPDFGVPWWVAVGTSWRNSWLGLCSYTVWLCFMALWYVFFCCWVLLGNLKYREEESDEKNVSNDR